MWMTGFDVECCGAIYLDKPMRNHSLMQTIARANRVFEGKANGLIVDYVGVFRNLQKALAIYGTDARGEKREGDSPVQPKEVQIEDLRLAIDEAKKYAQERGVDVAGIAPLAGLPRLAALRDAVDRLVHPENVKRQFVILAGQADRLYHAVGADARKADLSPDWCALTDIARGLHGLEKPVDISEVMSAVDRLLDESVAAKAFVMRDSPEEGEPARINLGTIDFEALKRFFDKAKHKAASTEALIVATRARVAALIHLNPTRVALGERFEQMIAEYNAGSQNVSEFFEALLAFMKNLEAEEARGSGEGLTAEQLAVYDLLQGAGGKSGAKDRKLLKTIAKDLPKKIAPKLVIDWRKGQHTRAAVKVAIKDALDNLPQTLFDDAAFDETVEAVFEHIYESYLGEGKSKYTVAV
jgi:type I restriction enzyme R subunit